MISNDFKWFQVISNDSKRVKRRSSAVKSSLWRFEASWRSVGSGVWQWHQEDNTCLFRTGKKKCSWLSVQVYSPWIVVGVHSVYGPAVNCAWRGQQCSGSGSPEPLAALLRVLVHVNWCCRSGTIRKGVYSALLLWGWRWSDCLDAGHQNLFNQ